MSIGMEDEGKILNVLKYIKYMALSNTKKIFTNYFVDILRIVS